jgi:hypothetical protein
MKLKFEPTNQYTSGNTVQPIGVAVDYEDLAVSTSLTALANSSSFMLHNLSRPWEKVAIMFGVESAGFVPTSTPVNTFVIKTYADALSLSSLYGIITIEYIVQFRGIGI